MLTTSLLILVHTLIPWTSLLQWVILTQFTDEGTNTQLNKSLNVIKPERQGLILWVTCTSLIEYLPHGIVSVVTVIMIPVKM